MAENLTFSIDLKAFSTKNMVKESQESVSWVIENKKGSKSLFLKQFRGKSSGIKEKFMNVLSLLRDMICPCLLPIEGAILDEEVQIISPFMKNGSIISRDKDFSPTLIVKTLIGVSKAMQSIHSVGISHSRLRPSQVLLDDSLHPRVSDYIGINKMDPSSKYSPPEGLTSFAGDVYSFGCMVVELFGGKIVFSKAKTNEKPKKIITMPTMVPFLQSMIKACIENEPEKRPSFNDIYCSIIHNASSIHHEAKMIEIGEYLSLLLHFEHHKVLSKCGVSSSRYHLGKSIIELEYGPIFSQIGDSLVHKAAIDGETKAIEYLEQCKELASKKKKTKKIVKKTKKQKPDPIKLKKLVSNKGTSDLFEAARIGNLEKIKFFVYDEGMSPNSSDSHGLSILHYASQFGHLNILQYLSTIQNVDFLQGADWGRTPLHYAAEFDQCQIIQFLLSIKGVDINIRSADGVFLFLIGRLFMTQRERGDTKLLNY